MALGGCYSCIKYLMFAFNFLFWLLGCAILGVGIWVRVDPSFQKYAESTEMFEHFYTGAYILISVGVVVMVIGFLGCCGAIRESQCMLATFFIFLFLIFVVLLAAGIWAIVVQDKVEESVTTALRKAVDEYHTKEAAKELMDNVQTSFECCGVGIGSASYLTNLESIPSTCKISSYVTPCDKELFNFFADNLIIIAGVAIGIGVIMLMGMVFSCCLCCAIRRNDRIAKYTA